jgi:surface antigen
MTTDNNNNNNNNNNDNKKHDMTRDAWKTAIPYMTTTMMMKHAEDNHSKARRADERAKEKQETQQAAQNRKPNLK